MFGDNRKIIQDWCIKEMVFLMHEPGIWGEMNIVTIIVRNLKEIFVYYTLKLY